jgi:hypothetical protein
MSENDYSFITHWEIAAPLHDVWNSIYESADWPLWWKGVKQVTIIKENDSNGINGVRAYTWKSVLPYSLSFEMKLVEKIDEKLLRGVAFGELEGEGTWHFARENGITKVQYNWNVKNEQGMDELFFVYLKATVQIKPQCCYEMGAHGLAKKLNAKLISY